MWSHKVFMFLVLCQYSVLTYAQISKKFFRIDYTYLDDTESFYNIHTIPKTWQDAKKTCNMEGTSLFYPGDDNEAEVVLDFMTRSQNFSSVFVGASALLAKGVYETIDGVPLANLYHNWAAGEPNGGHSQDCVTLQRQGTLHDEDCTTKYPFICKKALSSLQDWDHICNMPNRGYEYNEALGRCYKYHLHPLSWPDAYATCSAEQSYLVVINSQLEPDFLVNMTARAPKDTVSEYHLSGVVHVGFHKRDGEGWKTIKGVPLADSGYPNWAYGEPNNAGGNEECGSMYYTGPLNDLGCQWQCMFICEHEVEKYGINVAENEIGTSANKPIY